MYRIIIVTTPVSAPGNWKHEGNILLPWKLARYLALHLPAHVYLTVADLGPLDFLPPAERVTVHRAETLSPDRTVMNFGKPISLRALGDLVKEVGPDAVICLNSRLASMVAAYFEADTMRRVAEIRVPVILWEGTPAGYDIVEARSKSGGQSNAGGYMAADQVWCFSLSHAKAIQTEVTRAFGFSQAQALLNKLRILSIVIDREYMDQVVPAVVEKRPVFTVHIGGRWSMSKNYPLVAAAVTKLQSMGEEIALLNTGMTSKDPDIVKAVKECRMEMVTGLTQEAMWEVAKSCHVGVLAQDAQAVPALALEQLALGLPLLVRSTERLQDVLPKYPLVWTDLNELMALILDVKNDYEGACLAAGAWFTEYGDLFDLSGVLPVLHDKLSQRNWTTVAIRFTAEGVVEIASRGTTMIRFKDSLFERTMARREAQRFPDRYVEELDNPLPIFRLANPEEQPEAEPTLVLEETEHE